MLVFYSWSVRGVADTISQFAAVEKIGWLARETPQEGDEWQLANGSNKSDPGAVVPKGTINANSGKAPQGE